MITIDIGMVKPDTKPKNRLKTTMAIIKKANNDTPKKTLNTSLVPVCLMIPLYDPTNKKLLIESTPIRIN